MRTIILKDGTVLEADSFKQSAWHNVQFTALADVELTRDQVEEAQVMLGYHPAGYDCWGIKQFKEGEKVKITWECARSCD